MKTKQILYVLVFSTLALNIGVFSIPKTASSAVLTCTYINSTMQTGSRDAGSNGDVTKLQNFLNAQGYLKVEATGYFGTLTANAVKSFQTKEGLPSVGIVGPLTKIRIRTVSCTPEVLPAPSTPTTLPTPPKVETPAAAKTKLPYSSSNFLDWNYVWGKISTTTEGALGIKASENTNGGQVLLPKTEDWTNYRLNVNTLVKQATVTLISRYVDENNFLGCTFSGKYVEIIERVDGNSKVVASVTLEDAPYILFFYNDLNLSMKVKDKTVGCTILGSGDNVSYTGVNDKLLKGGVGIQIWASTFGLASVDLKNVKVEAL